MLWGTAEKVKLRKETYILQAIEIELTRKCKVFEQ